MITITTNVSSIRKFMEQLPSRIARATELTIKDSVNQGVNVAKSMAPEKTGMLKNMLVSTMINKNQGEILSTVRSTYPYHFWVNAEPGFELLSESQITEPYFMMGQNPFRYGDRSVVSPSGKGINWTGEPGFFTKTFNLMVNKFPHQLARRIGTELQRGA